MAQVSSHLELLKIKYRKISADPAFCRLSAVGDISCTQHWLLTRYTPGTGQDETHLPAKAASTGLVLNWEIQPSFLTSTTSSTLGNAIPTLTLLDTEQAKRTPRSQVCTVWDPWIKRHRTQPRLVFLPGIWYSHDYFKKHCDLVRSEQVHIYSSGGKTAPHSLDTDAWYKLCCSFSSKETKPWQALKAAHKFLHVWIPLFLQNSTAFTSPAFRAAPPKNHPFRLLGKGHNGGDSKE